jgi:hypothetical protein
MALVSSYELPYFTRYTIKEGNHIYTYNRIPPYIATRHSRNACKWVYDGWYFTTNNVGAGKANELEEIHTKRVIKDYYFVHRLLCDVLEEMELVKRVLRFFVYFRK